MPMKPVKWNTVRAAIYGSAAGAMYAVIRHALENGAPTGSDDAFVYAGLMIGGAAGGAALFAIASGIRNLFIR